MEEGQTTQSSEQKNENNDTQSHSQFEDKGPSDEWKQHADLPHGPFQELFPGRLWQIEGSLKNGIKRNMVVYKMDDGNLWLHSVIALDEEANKQLLSFGTPKYLIVPNGQHTIDTVVYQKRYPSLQVFCPNSLKDNLLKRPVRVDGDVEQFWQEKKEGVQSIAPPGIKKAGAFGLGGEVVWILDLDNDSAAVIFCDLLSNNVGSSGMKKFFFGSTFECPRAVQWFGVTKKADYKKFLNDLADNPKIKIASVAHGPPVTTGVSEALKNAANGL